MAKPRPRSPPRARSKVPAEVQILDGEIGLLKEELQSLEGLQSVYQCCKEVHEFVASNPDPLILLATLCFNSSWICCSCVFSLQLETLRCCFSRRYPKASCCNCGEASCCRPHCLEPSLSCPGCSCGCVWSCCPNCVEVHLCPRCTKTCCSKHCLC